MKTAAKVFLIIGMILGFYLIFPIVLGSITIRKINEAKSKINDIYEEIGKIVYQKHASNEEVCIKTDLEEECAKIDELSAQIEGYHKEILALSNVNLKVGKIFTRQSNVGIMNPEIKPF